MDPRIAKVFRNGGRDLAAVSESTRLTSEHQQLVMSFRRPPVYAAAQKLWYQAKALEVAASMFFRPVPGEELFCERYKRLSQERVERVIGVLKDCLANPPSLEELGRRVGCSPFHLSRLFTAQVGKSIWSYLRDLRMERAAELLTEGKLNVTETSLEVGYSSLSHFTVAFRETFGCCPGLFPLQSRRKINR
jgi:AraC-like DNA-binding protein